MRRSTKLIVAGTLLALLALGGLVFASPYLAVRGMRQAAEAQDAAKLSEYVDFPALRQSLKDTFNARLTEELRKDPKNPLASLGLMFSASIVGQLVDAFTTPENLVRLLQGRMPQEVRLGSPSAEPAPAMTDPAASPTAFPTAPTVAPTVAADPAASQTGAPSAQTASTQAPGQSSGQAIGKSSGQSSNQASGHSGGQNIAPAAVPAAAKASGQTVSMGYEDVNRFVVRVRGNKPGAEPLMLTLRRDGIFSWKLCAVTLPK